MSTTRWPWSPFEAFSAKVSRGMNLSRNQAINAFRVTPARKRRFRSDAQWFLTKREPGTHITLHSLPMTEDRYNGRHNVILLQHRRNRNRTLTSSFPPTWSHSGPDVGLWEVSHLRQLGKERGYHSTEEDWGTGKRAMDS